MLSLPADPGIRTPVVLLSLVTVLLVAVHYLSIGRTPYMARCIGAALLGPPTVLATWALGLSLSDVGAGPGESGPAVAYGLLIGLGLQPVIAMSARSLRDNPPTAEQGPWVATAAMMAMYVLYHLKQEASETLGSMPVGVLFAVLAFRTQTFVGPFVAHVLIGVGNDTWVLWFQGKFPPGRQSS